jgi:hypothetical protein
MSDWTKHADWIPYTNAVAQTVYYMQSIKSTEKALAIMDIMDVPTTDPGYIQTVKELERKVDLLEIARYKIKRSWKRITETDKAAWADKIPF